MKIFTMCNGQQWGIDMVIDPHGIITYGIYRKDGVILFYRWNQIVYGLATYQEAEEMIKYINSNLKNLI